MRWNYYKLRQLSLLQSAMDSYYKLRQLFYYKVRHVLLQIATGITKCDDYYNLRQYSISRLSYTNNLKLIYLKAKEKVFSRKALSHSCTTNSSYLHRCTRAGTDDSPLLQTYVKRTVEQYFAFFECSVNCSSKFTT